MDDNINNENIDIAEHDLANQFTHVAMLMRRLDMAGPGHPGRQFGGVRAGQGRVLHILTLRSPMPQKELAYMLGVRPQSLSELLGKLEAAGLVQRRRDDEDRRTVIVEITEDGRAATADTPEPDDPFDVLSDEEQEQLADMLHRVGASLREKLPERPQGGRSGRGGFGGGPHGPRERGHGPRGDFDPIAEMPWGLHPHFHR